MTGCPEGAVCICPRGWGRSRIWSGLERQEARVEGVQKKREALRSVPQMNMWSVTRTTRRFVTRMKMSRTTRRFVTRMKMGFTTRMRLVRV